MTEKRALILHPQDNVASALDDVLPGEAVEARLGGKDVMTIEAQEQIPFGFKLAVREIALGDPIIKYGETIGHASRPIKQGALVHIHNLGERRDTCDLRKNV